jgi:hypothetical protein
MLLYCLFDLASASNLGDRPSFDAHTSEVTT